MNKDERRLKFLLEHPNWTSEPEHLVHPIIPKDGNWKWKELAKEDQKWADKKMLYPKKS